MAQQTFTWRAAGISSEPLADGMCAIVNNSTGTIQIKRIEVSRPSASVGTTLTGGAASGTWSIYRVSAVSGGDEVTPDKHDTNASDLPTEVTFRANPEVVTTGALFRSMRDNYYSPTGGTALFGGLAANTVALSRDKSRVRTGAKLQATHDGTVNGILLAEGEGIAEVMTEQVAYARSMMVHVVFRVESANSTFSVFMPYQCETPGCAGKALWSLFNDTGSGVSIRVLSVDAFETGSTAVQQTPALRLIRLGQIAPGSMNLHAAPADELLAHDTNNTLPATVRLWKGPFRCYGYGQNAGGTTTWYTTPPALAADVALQQNASALRVRLGLTPRFDAGVSTVGPCVTDPADVWTSQGDIGAIVLPPGQGIALCDGNAGVAYWSALSLWTARILMTYIPPAAAPSGSGVSRSRILGGV